ncbi:hypothetical protein V8E54_014870 [Elaphomyces granulatus]
MKGYHKLAALMGSDYGLSIYRRFAKLNARNLLYLQAELVNLEAELENIILEDNDSGDDEKKLFSFSLWHLKHSSDAPDGDLPIQWQKVLEIRRLLKEYNEPSDDALLQQAHILRLNAPNKFDLRVLRQWLDWENGGDRFLRGREADPWEVKNTDDLVTVANKHNNADKFTLWVYGALIPWYHKRWGHHSETRRDPETGVWKYNDGKIFTVTNVAAIIVSALLPTSSMLILFCLDKIVVKLAVIFIYTILFALALAIVVRARSIEIFGAATAFAAVQAVFISNCGNNGVC